MKNYILHKISIFLLLLLFLGACSTVNNTWYTRTHHTISTKYNVLFNGMLSYEEGIKAINDANEDDYSTILNMYPISNHSSAQSAIASMDRTIEKCRKSIKLYSIKKKPTKNVKKWNNPDYQSFYKQSEFNPALKDAWILLGKAEFHKADFLGAIGTFSYIARLFSMDAEMVAISRLWMVRAYAEMGWMYDAEQILSTVNQDALSSSNTGLFASVNADFLLKGKRYKEAIPYLQLALSKEKDKMLKLRFFFLLAQLYQNAGDYQLAYETYTLLLKENPSFEMDFNARVNRAQLNTANIQKVRKELEKMVNDPKNELYLDQLYYALGNSYLQKRDTVKAVDNYQLSVEKSKRKGLEMAISLIAMGDLYYVQKKYVIAQPAYSEASKVLTKEHSEFQRVSKLAETLSELVIYNDIVILQDSLQRLALMPEDKRLKVIEKVIERLIQEEKEIAAKELELANRMNNEDDMGGLQMIGGNRLGDKGGEWYFYNAEIMKSGRLSFMKLWGNRKLEDNWRRKSKSATIAVVDYSQTTDNRSSNSENDSISEVEKITDVKSPAFYLQQIPITKSQKEKSDEELSMAMYNLALTYKDKVADYGQATSSFNTFISRFPNHKLVSDALFNQYMMQLKLGNKDTAEAYRSRLVMEFPQSRYSQILALPDYVQSMERMYKEQDSLYRIAYNSYMMSDFAVVKSTANYVQQNYPFSSLLPKFMFLRALSVGKTEDSEHFSQALDSLITKYPSSDVSALAKDIAANIKLGEKSVKGMSQGTLLARRSELISQNNDSIENVEQNFSVDKLSRHRILLIGKLDKESQNKLLFEVASYNFSRFLIKDFDLMTYNFDSIQTGIVVLNLESYDEAYWYVNSIQSDTLISEMLKMFDLNVVVVSDQNYRLINRIFSVQDYQDFENKNLKVVAKGSKAKGSSKFKNSTNLMLIEPKIKSLVPVVDISTAPLEGKMYKNLFVYKANDPHVVVVNLQSAVVDLEKVKRKVESYLTQNMGKLSLKLTEENVGKQILLKIGVFSDASEAKLFFQKFKSSNEVFQGMNNTEYQVLIGGSKNINTMVKQNAMKVYLEFMQLYY